MSAALGLLLIAQLNSFEFTTIPSPQYAGDTFSITMVAKDSAGAIYPYNGSALLSTNKDDYWTYVYPSLVAFQNGVWQGGVIVTLAESLKLRCLEPQHLITGESKEFQVLAGLPARFLTILPGEELAPGSPEGRLPNPPQNQVAGDSFLLEVYVTDAWHNVVEARSDSVYFSATDNFALLPSGGQLSNGAGAFDITLRAAGLHRILALPAAGSPLKTDTSSAVRVVPGSFAELLVLLPGEAHLPGDTLVQSWQTPGKSGEPSTQFLRVPFPVTVYACDRCWNRVTAPQDTVALSSHFSFEAVPASTELADSAAFTVQYNTAGPRQDMWVEDLTTGWESYLNWLDVRALGTQLEISAPDTVRAGETTLVRVTVRDENSEPVTAAACRFAVINQAGTGRMLDTALLTDTLGHVTARFLCNADRGPELDTVRVTATATGYAHIFVKRADAATIGSYPNPFGFNSEATTIYYVLPHSCEVSARIYDPFGNEVRSWHFAPNQTGAQAGENRLYWDGRNTQGRRVANGMYLFQVIGQRHTGTILKWAHRIGVLW